MGNKGTAAIAGAFSKVNFIGTHHDKLKKNNMLRILDLSNNKLGDKGCSSLAHLFSHLEHIELLNLAGNKVEV